LFVVFVAGGARKRQPDTGDEQQGEPDRPDHQPSRSAHVTVFYRSRVGDANGTRFVAEFARL
jgi:hypothetical protein